jgi:hypothetical protein
VGFEHDVKSSVDAVLEQDEFESAELREVSTEYVDMGLVDTPNQIVVMIADSSGGETYPELEDALQRRIASDTGLSVDVLVEFRNLSSSNDSESMRRSEAARTAPQRPAVVASPRSGSGPASADRGRDPARGLAAEPVRPGREIGGRSVR